MKASHDPARFATLSNPPGFPYRLPALHFRDTVFRMKITLNIDDTVMAQLERKALRQGRTLSDLVETAERTLVHEQRRATTVEALPTFHSGGELVDGSNRDALYDAMTSK